MLMTPGKMWSQPWSGRKASHPLAQLTLPSAGHAPRSPQFCVLAQSLMSSHGLLQFLAQALHFTGRHHHSLDRQLANFLSLYITGCYGLAFIAEKGELLFLQVTNV